MGFFYKHRILLGFSGLVLAVAVTFAFCFFALSRATAQSLRLTVVIDAGHGGVDGGVVGTVSGTKESDINLALTFLLQKKFVAKFVEVALPKKNSSKAQIAIEKTDK